MDQLDLIDIYRIFHLKTMNFNFFSSAHRTFSRIDHILGHKPSLGKLKKIERLNNMLLNNQQLIEEIKICTEMNENENTTDQTYEML